MEERPKIRYDHWTEFHNPTTKDFVGKWDGEEYLIPKGTKQVFPVWLARHFAKRLCDDEMIKHHRVPLRPDAPERKEFISKCLAVDLTDIDTTVHKQKISIKDQIEADRVVRLEEETEQGLVLEPLNGQDIPIGDDEIGDEEDLKQELTKENMNSATIASNPTGKDVDSEEIGKTEFTGEVANIKKPIQPPGFNVES